MATTLLQLMKRVASLFGPMYEGTATSGSITSIVDGTIMEPDDFWNKKYAYITDAGGAEPEGEECYVSDFVQATGTVTCAPKFTTDVEAGDKFVLLSARRASLVAAINNAIERAAEAWGIPTIDATTISIASGTYQYNLPSDLVWLADVLYRSESSAPYRPIERALWSVSGTVGAQVLDLLDISGFTVGDKLRLDYVKRIPQLSADSDTLAIGAPAEPELIAFLIDYSLWYLHNQAAANNVSGGPFREHYTQARNARESAEKLLQRAPTWRRAGRWHTPRRPSIRG